MAKRDIPEINAGSMADIAFLLLLFFLVTTTMDKDQAYIRKIPKKIDLPPLDNKVQERDILALKANNQNQLMVRNSIFRDPDKISDFVLKFYQTNEKNNDLENNFPMYSTTTISLCDQNMSALEKQLEEAEQKGATEQAKFFQSSYEEWNKKKRAIQLYGKSEIRELSVQAHIRIEVQQGTAYSIFTQIHNEIEEAIFEMRDKECNRLFSEKYSILKRRTAQDSDPKDKDKIALLEILYPARIIEVTPKN
jgi:biopolymer transport protein ExbD